MGEEKKLVKKARSGDRAAMEELLADNYRIVKGYLIKTTLNPSLAEDITQETMVKAITNIKKYKPRGKFSSWLITIANNLYRDYLRKHKRESLADEGDLLSILEPEGDQTGTRVEMVRLQEVLSKLPYEKRAVVVLKHYYGYTYQDIAKILECPVGTVRSRLHYSLDFLRKHLAKEGDE